MRSCCSVAVFFAWFLLVPPVNDSLPLLSERRVDVGAPLSRWAKVGSADSMAGCRAKLETDRKWIWHTNGEIQSKFVRTYSWWPGFDMAMRIDAGQCVADDDPRLKAK